MKTENDTMGQPPTSRNGRIIPTGEDVIITASTHPMHGKIGEYVGLADSLGVQRYRISLDGEIITASQREFDIA